MIKALITIAVFAIAGASLILIGSLQTAKADIPSNANRVGQTVNNNGFQSRRAINNTCKLVKNLKVLNHAQLPQLVMDHLLLV